MGEYSVVGSGADCKSVAIGSGGSIPSSPTILRGVNMLFDTNKNKGRAGLASAIGYFGTHGYTVSIPLNDTQDYDLIVDYNGLKRVSIKATSHRNHNGVTTVALRNMGGTDGKVYGREQEKDIDFVFVVNENSEMWLLPKDILTTNSMSLDNKYKQYKLN